METQPALTALGYRYRDRNGAFSTVVSGDDQPEVIDPVGHTLARARGDLDRYFASHIDGANLIAAGQEHPGGGLVAAVVGELDAHVLCCDETPVADDHAFGDCAFLLHTGFDKCWLGKQVWASLHQLVLDGEAAARGAASFCCEGGKDDRPRFTGRRTASEPDRHRYAGTGGNVDRRAHVHRDAGRQASAGLICWHHGPAYAGRTRPSTGTRIDGDDRRKVSCRRQVVTARTEAQPVDGETPLLGRSRLLGMNDRDDVGTTTFLAEYPKPITLMRYIRKAIDSGELVIATTDAEV